MNKLFCDRCEKEITPIWKDEKSVVGVSPAARIKSTAIYFDIQESHELCDKCSTLYDKIMSSFMNRESFTSFINNSILKEKR